MKIGIKVTLEILRRLEGLGFDHAAERIFAQKSVCFYNFWGKVTARIVGGP